MADPVLKGIVVAELGARIGAGVCGSLLAQLGGRVIVPELPVDFAYGKSLHRNQLMPGKLSLVPRQEDRGDRELLRAIVARSDIVIVSSDVDPAFLGSDVVNGRDARQIICDVSAFGDSGPLSGLPSTDVEIQALSGILDTTGLPDGPPTPIRFPIVEFMTGVYAAAASLAALRVRRLSGAGQSIDMALYDCAFVAMSTFLPRLLDGSNAPVMRMGNRHAMAAPWNVYQAQDGWILVCAASDQQWRRVCQVIGQPELAEDARYLRIADRVAHCTEVDTAVQAWIGQNSVQTCLQRLGAAEIACGAVAPVDGYPREANLCHRGMIGRLSDAPSGEDLFIPASPLKMSESPGISPTALPRPDGDRERIGALLQETREDSQGNATAFLGLPLAGLRVLEIGHYTTAPLGARHLANLGADVIKVEPAGGEATRAWPPSKNGRGYFFTYTNSDKKSLMLDLDTEEGVEHLRQLIAKSDVLIENLKPGALAKRGYSWTEIAQINPKLIYCAVSGFGDDSIYKGRPAFDSVIQAMSGIMDLTRSGGVPVKSGISSADLMGAEMAVLAVIAAIEYREKTGKGQYIDLSMQDVAAWMTMTHWNGENARPQPLIVEAKDGYLVAEPQDEAAGAELKSEAAGCRTMTRFELASTLVARGCRAVAVLSAREMLDAPRTRERNLVFWAKDNDGESWPMLASPLRLKLTPPVVRRPMPELGHDSAAILEELGRAEPTRDQNAPRPGSAQTITR